MQDWAVSLCMPPLPEGVIPREALEEDESESTVPSDVEEEAPESSSSDTRKRSRSKDSDASSPLTPEGAAMGAERRYCRSCECYGAVFPQEDAAAEGVVVRVGGSNLRF